MELDAATAEAYLRHAYGQLLGVADRLGDPAINARPLGPTTNSVTTLVLHCCGVTEFWLGHVALGEPTTRDRDAEFTVTASLDELHLLVATTLDRAARHLARLEAGQGTDDTNRGNQFVLAGGTSDTSIVLHVLEELYQHLGQAELAADALLAP